MSEERVERRLAAILAADVVGYSRLMGEDEAGTLARLRARRRELIDPRVAEHKGRVVKTTGDGILIEFPSVVEAVACAVAAQRGMEERNAATPEHQKIVFRVGVNLGDVIVEDGDIHGDGVNVAARLEGIAEPGGICVSAEARRIAERPPTDLTAYDCYLRGLATIYPLTKERAFNALGFFEQAIAIDAEYGLALAWAATCHQHLAVQGWAAVPEASREKAIDFARRAIQAGHNHAAALVNAAIALARFGEDIDVMLALADRGLALNPGSARGYFASGVLRTWAGQHDVAIEHLEMSLRLSPRAHIGQPVSLIGEADFFSRRFDQALSKLLLSLQENPGFPPTYRALAACYSHLGRLDDARATIGRLRKIAPVVIPTELPWRKPEDQELLLSGLSLALRDTA